MEARKPLTFSKFHQRLMKSHVRLCHPPRTVGFIDERAHGLDGLVQRAHRVRFAVRDDLLHGSTFHRRAGDVHVADVILFQRDDEQAPGCDG